MGQILWLNHDYAFFVGEEQMGSLLYVLLPWSWGHGW